MRRKATLEIFRREVPGVFGYSPLSQTTCGQPTIPLLDFRFWPKELFGQHRAVLFSVRLCGGDVLFGFEHQLVGEDPGMPTPFAEVARLEARLEWAA